jgi:hypothetical protein
LMLRFQSQLFIHSYVSQFPAINVLSHDKGENIGHRPRRSKWTEGLHTLRCGLIPKVDRLRHCYHYPCAMQTSAR